MEEDQGGQVCGEGICSSMGSWSWPHLHLSIQKVLRRMAVPSTKLLRLMTSTMLNS
jgi:hypothetical protein